MNQKVPKILELFRVKKLLHGQIDHAGVIFRWYYREFRDLGPINTKIARFAW